MESVTWRQKDVTLLDLLDGLLHKGIVVYGDLMISVADVDLLSVGIRLAIAGVDKLNPTARSPQQSQARAEEIAGLASGATVER